MNDKAKMLVPQGSPTGLRRYLRTFWTGTVATVLAVGVLFAASASVPGTQPADGGQGDLPIRLYGLIESFPVGQTDTAPEGVTLAQIVAVLDRAEKEAQEQGPNLSPAVAQAAAELGMLYTTYQMQQLAFGENNEGLRIEDAPVRRDSQDDADTPAAGSDKQDDADKRGTEQREDEQRGADKQDGTEQDGTKQDGTKQDGTKQGDTEQDGDAEEPKAPERPRPQDDTPPAVQVSNERTSVIDQHDDDPQAGYVTYDEVVIAAVRLANMLDPSVPNALVEVAGGSGAESGPQRERISLRENLLDVVNLFGGTTTGYANGRIPADVLCPLDFAPGHKLRCDAAERFTALNEQFVNEFGYPIPITDSYRPYEAQVVLAGLKPHLAAIPGTSNHGWGIAVDLGNPIAGGRSPEYAWLRVHGPDYGWDNPSWARHDGAKPEPWHFEFFAAGSIPNRAIDASDVGTWTPSDPASPRYKPALDPKPSNDQDSGGVRKPATKPKPSDGPSDNPPSQKPTKPTKEPSPSPSKPDDPSPTPKPTPSPSPSPTPKPTPTPSPTPKPSATPTPTPTPTPSEPAPDPSEPAPDPSPTDEVPDPECSSDDNESEEIGSTDSGTTSPHSEDPAPDPCEGTDGTESAGGEESPSVTASPSPLATLREELDGSDDNTED